MAEYTKRHTANNYTEAVEKCGKKLGGERSMERQGE